MSEVWGTSSQLFYQLQDYKLTGRAENKQKL